MPLKYRTVGEEYERHKDLKKEEVKVLMEWASKQPHLPKITEFQAASFLHCCYFSSEAAKVAIENYFTIKTRSPEIFTNRSIKALKNIQNVALCTILPKLTEDGYHIMFACLVDCNAENWNFTSLNMFWNMVMSLRFTQEGNSNGQILVIDAQGHTFGHILRANPALLKKQMFYYQEAAPVRMKSIHVFNTSPIVDKALTFIKPLMKGKLLENFHLHTKIDTMFEYVPQELLPSEYGGAVGTIAELQEITEKNMVDNMDFFREEEKQVVDESKRVEKSRYLDEMFGTGIEGTFKKLDID